MNAYAWVGMSVILENFGDGHLLIRLVRQIRVHAYGQKMGRVWEEVGETRMKNTRVARTCQWSHVHRIVHLHAKFWARHNHLRQHAPP